MNQIAPTQPTPLAPETRLAATLPAAAWNVILAQLGEGPYRVVAPILDDLRAQLALAAERTQRQKEWDRQPPDAADIKREAS